MKKKFLAVLTLLLSLLLVACGEEKKAAEANPDAYPEKPLNVIIAYKAGGGTDVGAHILMAEAQKNFPQTFVIVLVFLFFWTIHNVLILISQIF